MGADKGYALSAGEGRGGPSGFLGTPVRMLVGGEETGGAYTLLQQAAERGFGPPLHVHHSEDEAFYLLSGSLRVVCGSDQWEVGAGGFVFLPREVPHSFLVTSETAEVLQLTTPSGFEHFAADLADVPLIEANIPRIAEASQRHGYEILGPPPFPRGA
ncbi:cupin domain-containing protein [Streptomyces sp. NPDC002896]|uniref:cupin domain-containing protein n=1 Tax=Streptomyces sp. NPDC002896 TaxID=3154438 RepID=UPI0033193B32